MPFEEYDLVTAEEKEHEDLIHRVGIILGDAIRISKESNAIYKELCKNTDKTSIKELAPMNDIKEYYWFICRKYYEMTDPETPRERVSDLAMDLVDYYENLVSRFAVLKTIG
jgi:uncharacterized protein (UPF0262 family)